MKTREQDAAEGRMVRECAFLAANARMPSGERLIDQIVAYANTVRAAKKAKWKQSCILPLEDDLIAVLEQFYRRAEWYREPTRKALPGV